MRTHPVTTTWFFFVAASFSVALAASLPCSPDLQVSWVVNNSATASELARAANCSGGAFHVEWIGRVEFPETIYVIDDTVMDITGAGGGAIADGADSKQFLNVVNATLRVSGLRIQNCATLNSGGAIYAEASAMSFQDTTWSDNTAGEDGGAVYVWDSSNVSWSGETTWSNNTAGDDGGAVYMGDSSDVSWSGETTWSNNTAGYNGGAVCMYSSSDVSWSGETTWSYNTADNNDGGAVYMGDSSDVSWSGETTWSYNTAGYNGGAVEVWDSSNVSWSVKTTCSDNTAGVNGGAVHVSRSWNVSWSGETTWSNNSAGDDGGAVSVFTNSDVSWSGETTWSNNSADKNGGAVEVHSSQNVYWSGETAWSDNTAASDGGAVYVLGSSNVSWSGETTWSNNTAGLDGGAVSVQDSENVSWSGETVWSYNSARLNGGAIYAFSSAVSMLNTSSLFERNAANGAGGAIMLSGVDVGPEFVQTNFTANNSSRGGAVYSVSSGIATDEFGNFFAVVYEDCNFTDNRASATGGAIESAAGYDRAVNTVFEGNSAGVGGALRLGGDAVLIDCTFVDNTAEDAGPAISNLGLLELGGNASRFSGNVFSCETGAYLSTVSGNRYEAVCDGCPGDNSDEIVSVENEDRVPVCVVQIEHTRSEGGDTTIETLDLDAGYWRATNDSVNVLTCYNEDACTGGTGLGSCQLGYEGPYCSVCSGGYSKSLVFTCTKCVEARGGIAVVVVVGVFILGVAILLCTHLVSGEMEGARRGVIPRFTERLPLQSIKIVVVVWQILTQFASVTNVRYPDVYQRFLDGVNILNFDALWIPSSGCIVDVDFHGGLLVSTIGPLVALTLLAITYNVAKRRNSGSEAEAALQKVGQKHVSMVLLISFLVYSSVSATVFQTFACEDLDDGKNYLRADYRIECDSSKHQAFQVLAGIMVLVYPLGIPLFYGYLLYKNRLVLKSEDEVKRETSPQVQPISDLWAPYKPGRFYYEVVECLRRIMLTGVVVFIYPNTAAQVAVTVMIAFAFSFLSLCLTPFVSKWDARIYSAGQVVVFMSMFLALLSKVDVSEEVLVSQEQFGGILVAAHACMVLAVIVEGVITFYSMRGNKGPVQRDCPRPLVYPMDPVLL